MKGIIQNIKSGVGFMKRGLRFGPIDSFPSSFSGGAGVAGINVNNETALRFTSVYAAMRLRSENLASLPRVVYEKKTGGNEIASSHPVHRLVHSKPNSYMNIFTFWEHVNTLQDGWGNSYVIIERDSFGDPVALWPVHPACVSVTLVNRKKFYKVIGSVDFDGTYSDDEMLHFMLMTKDGIRGINPIIYNAEAIAVGMAANKFGAEFFEKGGNISGVYETEGALGDEKYKTFMKHMKIAAQNFDKPLLEYGIKYKQAGISPEAAQMLGSKVFSVQDVSRIFNVPPHMLSELSSATFSNIEHQDIQFIKYSMRPSIKRYETEIENKLFFSGEKEKFDMKFLIDGMMRGDTKSRSMYYHMAIQDGFMNRNEVRAMENLNRVEGLDTYLYPGNLFEVGADNNKNKK